MNRTLRHRTCLTLATACTVALLIAPAAKAQLFSWTKEEMVEYTKAWTGERFPDGRPKVPESWLEPAKGMSQEEVIIPPGRNAGPANIASYSQFDGNFKVLHPELKMAGRGVTAMYMPTRADIDTILFGKARDK